MVKIYKIEFGNYIYFGSTKQAYLTRRQSRHNYNLKHDPKQKLYRVAIEQNIHKLNCILLCECEDDERLKKENELIIGTTDKIILNERLALSDSHTVKMNNLKYSKSEKGKLQKKKADKRYAIKHSEKLKLKKHEYYIYTSYYIQWLTDLQNL